MESFNGTANIWAMSVSSEEHKPLINIRSWWWWCTNAWRFKQTVKLASSCSELDIITYLYKRDSLKCGIVFQMNLCVSWLSQSCWNISAEIYYFSPGRGGSNDWGVSIVFIFIFIVCFAREIACLLEGVCFPLHTCADNKLFLKGGRGAESIGCNWSSSLTRPLMVPPIVPLHQAVQAKYLNPPKPAAPASNPFNHVTLQESKNEARIVSLVT